MMKFVDNVVSSRLKRLKRKKTLKLKMVIKLLRERNSKRV